MTSQHKLQVAVVMERIAAPNLWEAWQFRVVEVVPDEGVFGSEPRRLVDDGRTSRWLYPGFSVELFPDECKGYFLNLTSGQPAWFVSWLVDSNDPSLATVTAVSVSYIEADRRMTADEQVDVLPLESDLCEWLRVFTNEHFKPETKRKVRAMSFLSPEERERQTARFARAPADDAATGAPAAASAVPSAAELPPATDAQARNAALREMFLSDPHFRQSDGLDVGVDEVFEIEGSPQGRRRKILQARALGLLDDDLLDQQPPDAEPTPGTPG